MVLGTPSTRRVRGLRDTDSTQVAKWVPRKNLSRKPKSAEAMELDKEEKAWQHQLYRARQAKERAEVRQALKDRQKEIERANELEERSGERKRKFDVDACREKRAQAEAQVLIDEKKAAQDEILRLTLVASADAAGMDAVAFKVRSRRPVVLWWFHAIDATRVHQTRSWVVSFSSLRPFAPSRATAMLRAGPAGGHLALGGREGHRGGEQVAAGYQ